MARISDKELENFTSLFHEIMDEGGVKRPDKLLSILQELKERRAADKPLDIKGQLRLVRDRCPELWKMVRSDIADCPEVFQLSGGECLAKNCKECWDKALEGDE